MNRLCHAICVMTRTLTRYSGCAAAVQVGDEQLVLALERGQEVGLEVRPMLDRHRLVDLAPVDRLFGGRVADDELVLDAASGELAGIDQQRAVLGQLALRRARPPSRPAARWSDSSGCVAPVSIPCASSRCAGVRSLTSILPEISMARPRFGRRRIRMRRPIQRRRPAVKASGARLFRLARMLSPDAMKLAMMPPHEPCDRAGRRRPQHPDLGVDRAPGRRLRHAGLFRRRRPR